MQADHCLQLNYCSKLPPVLAVGEARFFFVFFFLFVCFYIGHCSLASISGKDSSTHAASNSRSQFPRVWTEKLSRTCCACSSGGSLFLPYPIQPHSLSPLMVRLKMTYLEFFQSNTIKNTTKRYVDCNAVSWFSICS